MILKMRAGRLGSPQYFRVTAFPATLGRASRANIWIPHPQVSYSHCRFERREDGSFWVVDLESRNGIRIDGIPVTAAPLKTGNVFHLGSLRFDVDLEDGTGESTEVFDYVAHGQDFFGQSRSQWIATGGLLALQTALVGGGSYLRGIDPDWFAQGMMILLIVSLAVPAVAFLLALFNRLHGGHYGFWPLLRRVSFATSAGWLWWLSMEVVEFNLPFAVARRHVTLLSLGLWCGFAVYGVARLIFAEAGRRRVARWSAGLAAGVCAVIAAFWYLGPQGDYDLLGTFSYAVFDWKRPGTEEALRNVASEMDRVGEMRLQALKKHRD